ncbi:Hypothetical protein, putative [Bodo saltans]|uniref:Uncharacterized protein n=1 Tax=Bodo saltans TaxID=75058 RepID=A0A0S4KKK9_BODSA|nr:Hypothetical protein, putative [Bodo saltans]|eukprot:CUI14163.1 Hypothetical protein, putative [Bodo saltans]
MNDPPAAPVDLHDVSLRSLDDDDQRRSNDAAMKSVEPAPHLEVANNEGSDTFVRRERDGQPQQSASHHRQPQVLSDSGNAFHHSTTALSARSSSFVSCDDAFQRQTSFMPPGANDTTTTALSMSHDNSNAAAADAKQTTGSHLQVIIGDVSVEETYYSPNSTALETPFSGTAPRPDPRYHHHRTIDE